MSDKPEHHDTTTLKAALGRLTAGSLLLFEYLLAVGTIAALIINMRTGFPRLPPSS